MFSWIKSLFGSMDRQTAAADRAAKAVEDIADMMEQCRDQIRGRLGIEGPAEKALAPAPETAQESEPVKRGRSRG